MCSYIDGACRGTNAMCIRAGARSRILVLQVFQHTTGQGTPVRHGPDDGDQPRGDPAPHEMIQNFVRINCARRSGSVQPPPRSRRQALAVNSQKVRLVRPGPGRYRNRSLHRGLPHNLQQEGYPDTVEEIQEEALTRGMGKDGAENTIGP